MFSPSRDDNLISDGCDLLGSFLSFFVPGFSFSSSQMGLNPFPTRLKLLETLEGRDCLVSHCRLSYWVGASLFPDGNHSSQCAGWGGLAPRCSVVPACPPFQSVPPRSWCILTAVSGSGGKGGIWQSSSFKDSFALSCSEHPDVRQWMW